MLFTSHFAPHRRLAGRLPYRPIPSPILPPPSRSPPARRVHRILPLAAAQVFKEKGQTPPARSCAPCRSTGGPPAFLSSSRPQGAPSFWGTTWTTRDNFHKGIGRTTPPDSRSRETIGKQKGQRAKRQTNPSDHSGNSLQKEGQTPPAPVWGQ